MRCKEGQEAGGGLWEDIFMGDTSLKPKALTPKPEAINPKPESPAVLRKGMLRLHPKP